MCANIEFYGPGTDKVGLICRIRELMNRLSKPERKEAGQLGRPEERLMAGAFRTEGCVVVAGDGSNPEEVVSVIVGKPIREDGDCVLMGATAPEHRGKGVYSEVKTELVTKCIAFGNCPIRRLITVTSNESVKKISKKLGFKPDGVELILNRSGKITQKADFGDEF